MVIIFQNEKVRNFLIKHGEVVTFRAKKRKQVGYDWMTDKRGGKKLYNVEIDYIGEVNPTTDLDEADIKWSGFDTLKEWWDAIRELNKGWLPLGHLYHVELYLSQEEAIERGIA